MELSPSNDLPQALQIDCTLNECVIIYHIGSFDLNKDRQRLNEK